MFDAGLCEHLHLLLRRLTTCEDIFLWRAEIEDFRALDGGGVDLGLNEA
jgi:hypothetical protein